MDEHQLLDRLKRGDPAARREAWDLYKDEIYQAIWGMARVRPGQNPVSGNWEFDDADVKDILSDAFQSFFKDIRKFQGQSSLKTWLYRIAMNRAVDFYREENRQRVEALSNRPSRRVVETDDEANWMEEAVQPETLEDELGLTQEDYREEPKVRLTAKTRAFASQKVSSWHSIDQAPDAGTEETPDLAGAMESLTKIQRQVVTLRLQGKTIKEIAEILDTSDGAVKMALGRGIKALRKTNTGKMGKDKEVTLQ